MAEHHTENNKKTHQSIHGIHLRGFVPPSRKSRFREIVFKIAYIIFFLLVTLGLYLNIIGLPAKLTNKIVHELRQNGFPLSIERLRWGPFAGIIADQISLYDDEDLLYKIVEAERANVSFNPISWLFGNPLIKKLNIRNGHYRILLQRTINNPEPQQFDFRNLNATINLQSQTMQVEHLSAKLGRIKIKASGELLCPEGSAKGFSFTEWRQLYRRSQDSAPEEQQLWLPSILELLTTINFNSPPEVNINFKLQANDVTHNTISFKAASENFILEDQKYDGLKINLTQNGSKLELDQIRMTSNQEHLQLKGTIDLETRIITGRLFSSLPLRACRPLLPVKYRKQFDRLHVSSEGNIKFDCLMGPARDIEVLDTLRGFISISQAELENIWIDFYSAFFSFKSGKLKMENIDLLLGKQQQQCSLEGQFTYDTLTQITTGNAKGRFAPAILVPHMQTDLLTIIRDAQFHENPPYISCQFQANPTNACIFSITGEVACTNFSYRGIKVDALEAAINFHDHFITAENLWVKRPEGILTGCVEEDIMPKINSFNIKSSISPKKLARVIAPEIEKGLELFEFNGSAHITAKGSIDYGNIQNMAFTMKAAATNVLFDKILADECHLSLKGQGSRFEINKATAKIHGGELNLKAACYPIISRDNIGYNVAATIQDVNFGPLVDSLKQTNGTETSGGILDAGVIISGLSGEGKGKTATGKGYINIKDGQVLKIAIFGGLSRFLSHIYTDWGFLAQTAFHSDFKVEQGYVKTDGFTLEGNVIRIKGKGQVKFNGDLDFDLRIKLLREGAISSVINLITYPITKLFLEFHLGGNLEEPNWRPQNLPKELYLDFD